MSARSSSKQALRKHHEQADSPGILTDKLETSPLISLLPVSTSIPSQEEQLEPKALASLKYF